MGWWWTSAERRSDRRFGAREERTRSDRARCGFWGAVVLNRRGLEMALTGIISYSTPTWQGKGCYKLEVSMYSRNFIEIIIRSNFHRIQSICSNFNLTWHWRAASSCCMEVQELYVIGLAFLVNQTEG